MSVTGYEAFCMFQALKLHFTNEAYDYFKYNGKSRTSVNAFESRKDKYFFYKLSRKLSNHDDLMFYVVANLVAEEIPEQLWIGNLLTEEAESKFLDRQKNIQNRSYIFENECANIFSGVDDPNEILRIEDGQHPILLKHFLRNEISIETICTLNQILNFIPMWKNKINDTVLWPKQYLKVVKYTAFLPQDVVKYKLILKKVINENQKVVY